MSSETEQIVIDFFNGISNVRVTHLLIFELFWKTKKYIQHVAITLIKNKTYGKFACSLFF
jgi:hypothetical protein